MRRHKSAVVAEAQRAKGADLPLYITTHTHPQVLLWLKMFSPLNLFHDLQRQAEVSIQVEFLKYYVLMFHLSLTNSAAAGDVIQTGSKLFIQAGMQSLSNIDETSLCSLKMNCKLFVPINKVLMIFLIVSGLLLTSFPFSEFEGNSLSRLVDTRSVECFELDNNPKKYIKATFDSGGHIYANVLIFFF